MILQDSRQKKSAPLVAVIGAGPAGLFAAHLALREGARVALFESHSKPGGCASFFRRKVGPAEEPVLFDAGATLLPDLSTGSLMNRLLKSFGVEIGMPTRVSQMEFDLRGRRLKLDTTSSETWIRSMAEAFPQDANLIRKRFPKIARQAEALRSAFQAIPHLPLQSWEDLKLNLPLLRSMASIGPALVRGEFVTFEDQLRSWGASDEFLEWIDMNLFITLQCRARDAHPLWGAAALFFYAVGSSTLPLGMRGLFEPMLEKLKADPRAKVFMRTPVLRATEDPATGQWNLTTSEGSFGPFDAVFSSVPRFASQGLFAPDVHTAQDGWKLLSPRLWSAQVAYLAVEDRPEWHQGSFHLHSRRAAVGASALDGGEFYASFSERDNPGRAPRGLRAVTLSTHTETGDWPTDGKAYRGNSDYLSRKTLSARPLVAAFRGVFPEARIAFEESATPSTFVRYTKRTHGSVGGLPLDRSHTGVFRSPSIRTLHPCVFQIGDTAFPGQSVQSCAMGAAAAVEKWLGRKLSV